MKKILFGALLVCGAIQMGAQNKIDYPAQVIMDNFRAERAAAQGMARAAAEAPTVGAIVLINDGFTADAIEAAGFDVTVTQRTFAIVNVALDQVEELAKLEAVKHITFGNEFQPTMDRARAASGVDKVHAGEDLAQPYTGKGVIAGIFDVGMDPNHINFTDADGRNRVSRLWVSDEYYQTTTYDTPEAIAAFTTENREQSHGTHVLGIMAGSYKGDVQVRSGATQATAANPYYGIAYNADIAMSCGPSYDANILSGVTNVIEYAEQQGKPAVVNLSFGNNHGPHDGSDAFCQALDELGQRAILVVAAGNEGDRKLGISRSFNGANKTLRTAVLPVDGVAYSGNDMVQFWINDNCAVKFSVVIYDKVSKQIVKEWQMNSAGMSQTISGADMMGVYTASSSLAVSTNVNTANNRYCISMTTNFTLGTDASKVLGFVITGVSGQKVNGYTSLGRVAFSSENIQGWTDGSTNGSISNMACGHKMLTVGSYNSRTTVTTLDGQTLSYGAGDNSDVSNFSSYGTLSDGREMPHICAPGSVIVSSVSAFNSEVTARPVAQVAGQGRDYHFGGMQGTSMACPYTAGSVALWLEADPTLKIDDVISIAQSTANKDRFVTNTTNSVRWGAGKLDAHAGLKAVLARLAGIGSVTEDVNSRLIVTNNGGKSYSVFVAGEPRLSAQMYTMAGALALTATAEGNEMHLDASSLPAGVYVLAVSGESTRYTKKLVVK